MNKPINKLDEKDHALFTVIREYRQSCTLTLECVEDNGELHRDVLIRTRPGDKVTIRRGDVYFVFNGKEHKTINCLGDVVSQTQICREDINELS